MNLQMQRHNPDSAKAVKSRCPEYLSIRFYFKAILLLCITLVSAQSLGLPSDRTKPIHIQSDRFHHDEKKGVTIHDGSKQNPVRVRQGTLNITARKITIYSTDEKIEKMIASGSPAHFQQKPELDKPPVIAEAQTIEYLVETEQLHLQNDALLIQNGTRMKAEKIDYDIKGSIVNAFGGSADNSQKGRINIVIPPSKTKAQPKKAAKHSTPAKKKSSSAAKPEKESEKTTTSTTDPDSSPAKESKSNRE